MATKTERSEARAKATFTPGPYSEPPDTRGTRRTGAMTKTESKWTPGPWALESDINPNEAASDTIVKTRDGAYTIARTGWSIGTEIQSDDEREANARLIAAAPDLVEAVKALLAEHAEMNGILLRIGKGFPVDAAHPDCARQLALAALARAGVTP